MRRLAQTADSENDPYMRDYLAGIDELLRASGSTTGSTMETEETARQYLAFHQQNES